MIAKFLSKLVGIWRSRELNAKKKTGLVLLGVVLLYWTAFPILPFLEIPNKLVLISAVAVVGEVIFILAVALLGQEYWDSIKRWARERLPRRKSTKAAESALEAENTQRWR